MKPLFSRKFFGQTKFSFCRSFRDQAGTAWPLSSAARTGPRACAHTGTGACSEPRAGIGLADTGETVTNFMGTFHVLHWSILTGR